MRRLCYLLVSLSVVLVKYYPQMGKMYSEWTGAAYYVGATSSKNGLGVLCLVSGIFFFWDTVPLARSQESPDQKYSSREFFIYRHDALAPEYLRQCHLPGLSGARLFGHHRGSQRLGPASSEIPEIVIPTAFALYVILAFGFNLNGNFAGAPWDAIRP